MGRGRWVRRACALAGALAAVVATTAIVQANDERGSGVTEPTTTLSASTTTSTSTTSTSTTTTDPPSQFTDGFLTGVVEPTKGGALPTVDSFAAAVGHEPEIVSVFTSFAQPFPAAEVAAIQARGAIAMVTLEPWPSAPGVQCTTDVATCIVAGAFDPIATAWATAAATSGGPLLLRFAHEPNLRHYPWGRGKVAPEAYVAAWRHIHAVFTAAGATALEWVWAYQAPGGPNPDPSPWWPGLDVVDWVAIDGYNAGTALSWGGWLSFESLFTRALRVGEKLAPGRPVLLSEMASSTAGGSRPQWIRALADVLAEHPQVCGLVWFEIDKEADWSVSDDAQSAAALGDALGRLRAAEADDSSTVCN